MTHGLGISDIQASSEMGLGAVPARREERASPVGLRGHYLLSGLLVLFC